MNFLEGLEAKAHQEEDTEAQANWLSKVSGQVRNVMLLGTHLVGHALGHPRDVAGEWQQVHYKVWQIRA